MCSIDQSTACRSQCYLSSVCVLGIEELRLGVAPELAKPSLWPFQIFNASCNLPLHMGLGEACHVGTVASCQC